MGTYLSKPVKEKKTEEGENSRLRYAATSMQGWRYKQEDAHNCIANFYDDCSLFSVFDGHGADIKGEEKVETSWHFTDLKYKFSLGSEVAQYAAMNLPNLLKRTISFVNGDYSTALTEAFLDFDARLRSTEVIRDLRMLSSSDNVQDEDVTDDEDHAALYEESMMPLQSILSKYGLSFREEKNGQVTLGDIEAFREQQDRTIMENLANAQKDEPHVNDQDENDEGVESLHEKLKNDLKEADEMDAPYSTKIKQNGIGNTVKDEPKVPVESSKESVPVSNRASDCNDSAHEKVEASDECKDARKRKAPFLNHKALCKRSKCTKLDEVLIPAEEQASSARIARPVSSERCLIRDTDKNTASSSDSESFDEDYKDDSSNEGDMQTSDEDCSKGDDSEEGNASADDEDDVGFDDDEDEDEDNDDDDDDDDDGEVGGEEYNKEEVRLLNASGEVPGEDSGTTACLALIMKDRIIVGNVGDSRAVLCRNGTAIDLSTDHKPEDEGERRRIEAAGGEVSADGRVNGGLNLSRALGDHFYKKNQALTLKDQMISSDPDVTEHLIQPEDEFIILACDGIWNSVNSQQGVNFVRNRLLENKKLSEITELICDECLSPDTAGDGTGCDNMTIIIIQLKHLQPIGKEIPEDIKGGT